MRECAITSSIGRILRRLLVPCVVDSDLLTPSLRAQLDAAIPSDDSYNSWNLLYHATRDGANAAAFHQLCDSKGPTLTVARLKDAGLLGKADDAACPT